MRRLILLALLLVPFPLCGVSVRVSPVPNRQFFDASGRPLAGGHVCTYAAGSLTPLATYTDSTGTTRNSICLSPGVGGIVLDAGGQAKIWIVPGTAYKYVVYNSAGALQWSEDNISIDAAGTGTYNVSLYGAAGNWNGTSGTDDTAALQAAINSAAPSCGVVWFPPGYFYVTGNLTVPACVSLKGSGSKSSKLHLIAPGNEIAITPELISPYQEGSFENLYFENANAPSSGIALYISDTDGVVIRDNAFHASPSNESIRIYNNTMFNERHQITGNQFYWGNPAIHYLQNPATGGASWGYNWVQRNHFQICNGCSAITLDAANATSASAYYNGAIDIFANFDTSATSGTLLKVINKAAIFNSEVILKAEGGTGCTMIASDGTGYFGVNQFVDFESGGSVTVGNSTQFAQYAPTVISWGNMAVGGGGGPRWYPPSLFANPPSGGTIPNGSMWFCTDCNWLCTVGGGAGQQCVRVGGVWQGYAFANQIVNAGTDATGSCSLGGNMWTNNVGDLGHILWVCNGATHAWVNVK